MAVLTLMKKEACSCKNHFPNKQQPFSIHQEADTKKLMLQFTVTIRDQNI
ncbi:hypothetical protein NC652_037359 [Populus alba x Populus x berolinensis]|nr:hypothetical protein NC652_037359 [Populus alba x Populus x berolinensis]